jgi:hypothetical protein
MAVCIESVYLRWHRLGQPTNVLGCLSTKGAVIYSGRGGNLLLVSPLRVIEAL